MPTAARKLKLPVPVSIITGHLGVGKTTLIAALLKSKPAGEHWAILVNEFGALGIDAAILEGCAECELVEDITVKELAGGCMCCTLAGPMTAGIATLVRRAKPDRLIIEPSGLGHPAGLLDVLQSQNFRSSLQVQAIVTLVDPANVKSVEWQQNDLVKSQLDVADVILFSKVDAASAADLAYARQWVAKLYPPKLHILEASNGIVSEDMLSLRRDHKFVVQHAATHIAQDGSMVQNASLSAPGTKESVTMHGGALRPGQPVRFESDRLWGQFQSRPHQTCGWMFHADEVFDRQALHVLLTVFCAVCARVKGVFRVGKEYVQLKMGADHLPELAAIAFRRESRIELIVHVDSTPEDTSPSTSKTLQCLTPLQLEKLSSICSSSGGVDALADAILHCEWDVVEIALQAVLKRCKESN